MKVKFICKSRILFGILAFCLISGCGQETSREELNSDMANIQTEEVSNDDETTVENEYAEENNDTEVAEKTPQEKYDLAKSLMKNGDLSVALEIFNEISSELDVAKEVELCSEYAEYVGFWKADEYDSLGSEIINDYLIYVSIPIDIDEDKKTLNIAEISYASDTNYRVYSYSDELYEMNLDGLVATKTWEPGYKTVTEFDLATGNFRKDYWSKDSTEDKPSTGVFVKQGDDNYSYENHLFYPHTLIETADTVIDGIQYALINNQDEEEIIYSYYLSRGDELLAHTRYEEYIDYLDKDNDLEVEDDVVIIDKGKKHQVTLSVNQYDNGLFRENDFILDVAVRNEKTEEEQQAPEIGMTTDEVLQSTWGSPDKKNVDEYSWGTKEQWVYENKGYIYFEDGIVTSISIR